MKKRLFSLFMSLIMAISLVSIFPIMEASAHNNKSESELKAILKRKISKNISEWVYADYDGDGTKEAFAIVGKKSYNETDRNTSVNVWFINNKGEITQMINNSYDGKKYTSFCDYYSDVKVLKQGNKRFLSFIASNQAPSLGFIFGVVDKKAYEFEVSGQYPNFTFENNKIYVSYIGTNSHGIFWGKYPMIYDDKIHEFVVADEKNIPSVKGFKVSSTSTNSIKLTWNKVKGATGYTLYQQKNGKWTKVKSLTGTSYTVPKLKAGTTYKFAVKAYKKIGNSLITSPSFPTVSTSTNPATVNFKLSAGSKKATVKWSKVTGATGYKVYYKTSKNGSWKCLKTANNKTTSYTKTGLKKGKTYYFTVKAYRTVGGKTYNGAFTTKSVKVK